MQEILYEDLGHPFFSPERQAIVRVSHAMGAHSRFDPHWHNAVEITLAIQNPIRLYAEGKVTVVEEGDIVFVNSGVVHSTEGSIPDRRVWAIVMLIPDEIIRAVYPAYEHSQFQIPSGDPGRKELAQLLERIMEETEEPSRSSLAEINAYLWKVIALLLERYLVPATEGVQDTPENRGQLAKEIMGYVDRHFREDLTLSEAAGKVALQENYFCRYFKKYVGMSFTQYLARVRLRYALSYLLEGTTVAESALAAGFPSEKAFSSWCRKVHGMSPTEYRRRKRQQDKNAPLPGSGRGDRKE